MQAPFILPLLMSVLAMAISLLAAILAGVSAVPLRGLRRKRHCRGGERRRDSCKDEKSHESLLIECPPRRR